MHRPLTALAMILVGTAVYAADPVGSDSFNTDPGFDLSTLTASNFYEVLEPIAAREGGLTFFDFTNSFGPLFQEHLLPEFEKKYGVKVEYVRGQGETAVQQLTAAHNSGNKAPADVYFVSSGAGLASSLAGGVIANVPLHTLLPNAAGYDPVLATEADGFIHGGIYMPFHRNQTSIAYNSAMVSDEDVPDTIEGLLDWARANPGKVAVTNPVRGGSGEGFMESLSAALVQGEDCRALSPTMPRPKRI